MYQAQVKLNGNHYFAGQPVIGSKIETRSDGTVWLFDDEESYHDSYGDMTRNEWVEVDESTIKEIKQCLKY